MSTFRRWSWLIGFGLGVRFAACTSGGFQCERDGDCATDSTVGTCQPDGWCSFSDLHCPSMQRYGEHAGDGLARECVPVASEGSSEATPSIDDDREGDTGGTPDGSGGPDLTISGTSSLPAADTEADPVEPGLDPDSSDGGHETSASDPPPPGCPGLRDDFDDGVVGGPQWHSWGVPETIATEEIDSSVRFTMIANAEPSLSSGLTSQDTFDFTTGYARIEIGQIPTAPTMHLSLQIWQNEPPCLLSARLHSNGSVHFEGNTSGSNESVPWLQLRHDGTFAYVERSADGVRWEPLFAPHELGCALDDAQVILLGGSVGAASPGPATAVESLELCVEPSP